MKIIYLLLLSFCLYSCNSVRQNNHKQNSVTQNLRNGNDLIIENKTFETGIDFTAFNPVQINENSYTTIINGQIIFKNCTFNGPIIAYRDSSGIQYLSEFRGNVSFINCKFNKEVNFKGSIFRSAVNFSESIFQEKTNFQDITAYHKLNFFKTFFLKQGFFQNARFFHRVNFMECTANANFLFQSAVFHDESNFASSQAYSYVDFSLVRFMGFAVFDFVNWEDRAVFNNAIFNTDARFQYVNIGDLSMKNTDKRGKYHFSQRENTKEKK